MAEFDQAVAARMEGWWFHGCRSNGADQWSALRGGGGDGLEPGLPVGDVVFGDVAGGGGRDEAIDFGGG